jgi:hypothetical protein
MAPLAESNPLSWLLSRPQLVFLLFAGAVWLVKILNRAKAAAAQPAPEEEKAEPEQSLGGMGGPAVQDPEQEQRRRLVREDILRKIAERRTPASVRELHSIVTATYGDRKAAKAALPVAQPTAPVIAPIAPAGAPARTPGSLWLEELRSRDSARRAILVREILGPPIALR